ncbi:MAG TPA: hypothetical protein VGB13_12030 [Candidatus Krumholzibacteria bacterium]
MAGPTVAARERDSGLLRLPDRVPTFGSCEFGAPELRASVSNLALVAEKYTETALHFEVTRLPHLLERFVPPASLALADLGYGDGPLFAALVRDGYISALEPVYTGQPPFGLERGLTY